MEKKEEKQRRSASALDLSNITVGGQPLTEDDLPDTREKGQDIASTRRQTMNEQRSSRYFDPMLRKADETKKVSKRVVHWSPDRIRRERGIMNKPFPTVGENILWVINNKGPVRSAEIEEELEYKKNQLSGVISDLYRHLGENGEDIITRERSEDGKSFRYSAKTDWSPESAYKRYKKRRALSRSGVKDIGKQVSLQKKKPDTPHVNNMLAQAIGEQLGVEVTVKGRIEILFGFVK